MKAIVFDLDGTLLDTIGDLADSVNKALDYFNLPGLEYSVYKKLIGHGALNLCESALHLSIDKNTQAGSKDIYKPVIAEFIRVFKECYNHSMNIKTIPYPGIEAALQRLQGKKIQLSVLSNKPDPFTKALIAQHFPDIYFTCIIGDSDSFPKKPDPASLLYIMECMGVTAEETLLVGDGETDILTALAANVVPVAALWGFRTREELSLAGATHFIENPEQINPGMPGWFNHE